MHSQWEPSLSFTHAVAAPPRRVPPHRSRNAPPRPSAQKPRPARVVRTMDLLVAILALAIEREDRLWIAWVAGMAGEIGVALLAQARPRHLQHEVVHRAVRIVAIRAVLTHRRVLEQERTALLGMALVASVVGRCVAQQGLRVAAMGVMAVGAGHLAFAQRHVSVAQDLRPDVLVTLEARVQLGE